MSSPPEVPEIRGAGGQAAPRSPWHALRQCWQAPETSVLLVIGLVVAYVAFTGPWDKFSSADNIDNLSRGIGRQAIFAIGELLVILTGGIDLSIGSLVAFDGMLLAWLSNFLVDRGMPVGQALGLAMGAVLAFSLLVGLIHATLIQRLKLPPFVVTLASMSILRSGALLLSVVPIPVERFELLAELGNKKMMVTGTPIGLPYSTVVLLVCAAVVATILIRCGVGRYVYAVGSNEEASRLSGVNLFQTRMLVYGGCSLLAGLASILEVGYSSQGDPSAGTMYELNAISAVVIGGGLLTGGRGSVFGTLLGTILLETLLSVINFKIPNPTVWRGLIVGTVLLAAITINQIRLMFQARSGQQSARSP